MAIAYAPGAEDNPLAQWLARRIGAHPEKRHADLRVLRAAVCVVAPDRRLSVTLRFDHGQVTLHDGILGIPDVTLCGDLPALEQLTERPVGLRNGVALLKRTLTELAGGQVKIYGLLRHPRLVLRVLRLLGGVEG